MQLVVVLRPILIHFTRFSKELSKGFFTYSSIAVCVFVCVFYGLFLCFYIFSVPVLALPKNGKKHIDLWPFNVCISLPRSNLMEFLTLNYPMTMIAGLSNVQYDTFNHKNNSRSSSFDRSCKYE